MDMIDHLYNHVCLLEDYRATLPTLGRVLIAVANHNLI